MAKKSKKPSLVEQSTRREFLRKQQEEQRKVQARNRRIVISVALVLAVVVIGVFAAVFWAQAQRGAGGNVVPPNANTDRSGIVVNPTLAAAAAHKVVVYLDYQCPGCAELEKTYGTQLELAASSGTISLEYRAVAFLDPSLRNDASTRAAVAAACADTVGVYAAYHDQVFTNQPQREGDGYTSEQLRNVFPAAVGVTGENLTKFQQCYDSRATQQFVQGVTDAAFQAGITGTPQVHFDGQAIDPTTLPTLLASLTTPSATPTSSPAGTPTPTNS